MATSVPHPKLLRNTPRNSRDTILTDITESLKTGENKKVLIHVLEEDSEVPSHNQTLVTVPTKDQVLEPSWLQSLLG